MRSSNIFNSGTVSAGVVGLAIIASTVAALCADDHESRERVVLMNSGRVMHGFATRNAGGWLVEQSNGRVQVPAEQVRVVADSLVDAYRQQRDSVVEPTPATHFALAQWCISYRLHDEARDELRNCLQLDPDHSTARKLLRRIDDLLDAATAKPSPIERPPHRTPDGFLTPDAESLGGLSNEAAIGFTQRIQPLLMNKCANASCHGTLTPAEKPDGFHLLPVRSGANAHRRYTERNLAEVLKYVDLQQPSLSPLMTLPLGAHGGTSGVFHGSTGNAQIKMLRAWIKTVAEEKRAEEAELSARPGIVGKSPRPTAALRVPPAEPVHDDRSKSPLTKVAAIGDPVDPFASDAEVPRVRSGVPPTAPAELTSAQKTGKPLANANLPLKGTDRAKTATPAIDDPFDPELFNRRFHARGN